MEFEDTTTTDTSTADTVTDTQDVSQEQEQQQPEQNAIAAASERNDRIFRHNAAQQRINRTNQQLRQRAERAEARLKELEGSDDPSDIAEGRLIESQLGDFNEQAFIEARTALEDRVHEQYGNHAGTFMSLIDKYADYCNKNEPELLDYYHTPYGLLLMGEWFKRMEHPQYRAEWQAFGKFQKQQVLHRFYEQITQLVEETISGSNVATNNRSTTPVVPRVTGGRQTEQKPADTDFGGQIDDAFKSFGYK